MNTEPRVAAPEQTDQEIEALLFKIEQQISAGHTISPANDNAMETWLRRLPFERAFPATPGILKALSNFEMRARNRAAEENAAGRVLVSGDFTWFADLATKLLKNAGSASGSPPNPQGEPSQQAQSQFAQSQFAQSQSVQSQSVQSQSVQSQSVPSEFSGSGEALSGAADPNAAMAGGVAPRLDTTADISLPPPADPPATSGPATSGELMARQADQKPRDQGSPGDASSPTEPRHEDAAGSTGVPEGSKFAFAGSVSRPASVSPNPQNQRNGEFYASRGDAMLAIKDVSAARKYYAFAAEAGHARAAAALARTYEPAFVAQLGAVGVRPDAALAASWYRRAAELGDPGALEKFGPSHTQVAR